MTDPCECGGAKLVVDWKLNKIVRCKECDDCIDKKLHGAGTAPTDGKVAMEALKQLDMFEERE